MSSGGDELTARSYAGVAHGDQKYGVQPYSSHLAAVRAVLDDFGYGGDLGVAAWLHDVLEDTHVTREELESTFGLAVTELVWAVTGTGSSRMDRNEDMYRKVVRYPLAVILKLADRIANVEASVGTHWLSMYQGEHAEFRARLGGSLIDEDSVVRMWSRLDQAINIAG
ncbi:MAG: hypothetical protein JWN03_5699 [Nocardia sp.]|uniref:HD domain-containing protein n=1 Tax=Nocardia sp. TaxID=1821 RepID=UPI00263254CB|nr:HD domain-containing protein [Nocardia sp.]MCU1645424.1 hypothetical protein [Nocardia sp.]